LLPCASKVLLTLIGTSRPLNKSVNNVKIGRFHTLILWRRTKKFDAIIYQEGEVVVQKKSSLNSSVFRLYSCLTEINRNRA